MLTKKLLFISDSHQWAQCEECSKWRKLPVDALLPYRFLCSDNKWEPERWTGILTVKHEFCSHLVTNTCSKNSSSWFSMIMFMQNRCSISIEVPFYGTALHAFLKLLQHVVTSGKLDILAFMNPCDAHFLTLFHSKLTCSFSVFIGPRVYLHRS